MFNPLILAPSLNLLPHQFVFSQNLIRNDITQAEQAERFELNEANYEGRRIKWLNQLSPELSNRIDNHSQQVHFVDGVEMTADARIILTAACVSQSYCICLNAFSETNQLILRGIGQSCFFHPVDLLRNMEEEMERQDQRIHHYSTYILGGVLGLLDDMSQSLWQNKDALAIEECILSLNGMITEEDSTNFDVIFTEEDIFFGSQLIEVQNLEIEEEEEEEEFSDLSSISLDSSDSETI